MKTVEYHGYYKDGRWHMDSFVQALRSLQSVPVVLTVREFKNKRSNQANRYYWSVVVEIIYGALKEGGIETTREGTHELLKLRFLKEDKPFGAAGEFITLVKSTTELDRDEFATYIEKCKQFAAEYLNINIPDPGEQQTMELAA